MNRNMHPFTSGIKRMIRVLNSLVGDPTNTELEHRMFNAIMLLLAITGFITFIQNFLTGNPATMQLISGIALFGGLGCYFVSHRKSNWRSIVRPSFTIFVITMPIGWITQSGSFGGMGYYYFLLIITLSILPKGKDRVIFLCLGALSLLIPVGIEYWFPEFITGYTKPEQRFPDVTSSIIICLFITSAMVLTVYNEYQKERAAKDSLLEELRKEKEIVEQSMREKQRLLSIVCHDIANFLCVVVAGANLMSEVVDFF